MSFADVQMSCDGFLGGRLRLWQPKAGYRAATDPVLLAAFVKAKPGESVLDLGCGAGAAVLCLLRRIGGMRGFGLELQPEYAELARRNANENGLGLDVFEGDVSAMPEGLRARSFDHVICNPPYHRRSGHTEAADGGRDLAHRGEGVEEWVEAGLKRLLSGGSFTMIQRADRLGEVLAALHDRAGDIRVLPVSARAGRPAGRVIVSGRKGSRAALTLLAPLVMHEGADHGSDGDDYSAIARGILREMQSI